jgi:CheY-like chemotaxis protein
MSYVLIVDDDVSVAETIADMVELMGWRTQIVHSPRAALAIIQRSPPTLILLDLNMPGISGTEVLRYIKRDPMAGDVPVVFITAEDDPSVEETVIAAGALDYLVKPVDYDRLERILNNLREFPYSG